jgi:hypothetical protein
VLERDLLWLLDRNPVTLGADQRKIREQVAQVAKKYLPKGKRHSLWKRIFG